MARVKVVRKTLLLIILVLIIAVAGYVSVRYYPYVFARAVTGQVLRVERVTQQETIIGRQATPSQMYSFAIAIRSANGEIHTASTEDRQWAVVQAGQCAEAKFFPYPPWEFEKGGTYFGARLQRLFDCPSEMKSGMVRPAPSPEAAPASVPSPLVSPLQEAG